MSAPSHRPLAPLRDAHAKAPQPQPTQPTPQQQQQSQQQSPSYAKAVADSLSAHAQSHPPAPFASVEEEEPRKKPQPPPDVLDSPKLSPQQRALYSAGLVNGAMISPKRPRTAWQRFCALHRAAMQAKLKPSSTAAVNKALGEKWRDEGAHEEKERLRQEERKEMTAYLKAVEVYEFGSAALSSADERKMQLSATDRAPEHDEENGPEPSMTPVPPEVAEQRKGAAGDASKLSEPSSTAGKEQPEAKHEKELEQKRSDISEQPQEEAGAAAKEEPLEEPSQPAQPQQPYKSPSVVELVTDMLKSLFVSE